MFAKTDKSAAAVVTKKPKKSKKHNENGAFLDNEDSRQLTKKQKKEIEAQADDEAGAISKEVDALLVHLKKAHSLSDDDEAPTLVDAAAGISGKKKKAKKGKLTGDASWQGTKSSENGTDFDFSTEVEKTTSPKKEKPKKKKHELKHVPLIEEAADPLPSVSKKKKKKTVSVPIVQAKPSVDDKQKINIESTQNELSIGKKKKKIKKEKQDVSVELVETKPILKTEKKKKKNKRKAEGQIKSEPETGAKKPRKNEDEEETAEDSVDEISTSNNVDSNKTTDDKPKTEYYLKNAFPVYVGNLPTNVKKKRILKQFQPFGDVLAVRLRTNTGKNFMKRQQLEKVPFLVAFVYFATEKAAEASLKLTGEKIGENVIYVDRDLDKKDAKSKVNPKTTLFVGNLKYQTTNAMLQDKFKCCGEIKYVRTVQCKLGCNGTAYVCFKNPESVDLALKLNKTLVLDREIRVERFHTKKLGGSKSIAKDDKSPLHGAALRLANKPGNEPRAKNLPPDMNRKAKKNDKKKKEFLGTKSNAKKKKFDPKKKVKVSAMKKLAAKIAPKTI